MKTQLIIFLSLIALSLVSCNSNGNKSNESKVCDDDFPSVEKWILIQDSTISAGGAWSQNGYINEKGDTVIPLDKYFCLSDTFEYYGVVYDYKNDKLVGIDKNEKILFEAVWNGEGTFIPEAEGRIMIKKDNKYGFANHKGEIVIEPQYACANQFSQGKTRASYNCEKRRDGEYSIWESNSWIIIDKCGNIVELKWLNYSLKI